MNKKFVIILIINILFIICASILFIQLFLQLGNTHERIRIALRSFDELREEYTADFKIVFERLDRLERRIEEVRNEYERRISQLDIDRYKQKDEVNTKATETSDISINSISTTLPINDYHGLEEDVLRLEDVKVKFDL
jgi:hypothetical protein